MKKLSQYRVILISSLFFTIFYNYAFFKNLTLIYPLQVSNMGFLISIFIILFSSIALFLTIFSSKYTLKPILISLFMISSFVSYFMNNYNIVIDSDMIRNIFETNIDESLDLFSFSLIFYFIFLGVIPSIFLYKLNIIYSSFKIDFFEKLKFISILTIIIVILLFSFSKFYTSFFREHKPLRYYVNPLYYIYSGGKYVNSFFKTKNMTLSKIGEDAKVGEDSDDDMREMVIVVVGEATRADRFSLNGYSKETNPLLKQEDIINFSNMQSCGTSTAVSVPCMFSILNRGNFDNQKALERENILDVLIHTNYIDILWRDNNSDSKGVATRVEYESFKNSDKNPICDVECRDEGMLFGLDTYIENHKNRDILIVLHQMGAHGPAYYKRYPKEFEKFKPTCNTNQLEQCTQEEVSNTYDNVILYTDYFLSKVINFLKNYSDKYETVMFYISDHGESLGENGLYLHGLPYFMAPDEQTHIASLLWFGDAIKDDINITKVYNQRNQIYSQDNLFHTLLGIFEVNSTVYQADMDILQNAN